MNQLLYALVVGLGGKAPQLREIVRIGRLEAHRNAAAEGLHYAPALQRVVADLEDVVE